MWAGWEQEENNESTSVPMTRQDNELFVRVPARMRNVYIYIYIYIYIYVVRHMYSIGGLSKRRC